MSKVVNILLSICILFVTCSSEEVLPINDDTFSNEKNPNLLSDVLKNPLYIVHRGLWSINDKIPENSRYSFKEAIEYGLQAFEMDVKWTSDSIPVIMHDGTINRTMVNKDGSSIESSIYVASSTYNELRSKYRYKSDDINYQGEITTLEEALKLCKENSIIPLIHNLFPHFEKGVKLIQSYIGDQFIFLGSVESCQMVRNYSKKSLVLLSSGDGKSNSELISYMENIGGLVGYSSMSFPRLDEELIAKAHEKGFFIENSCNGGYQCQASVMGIDIQLLDNLSRWEFDSNTITGLDSIFDIKLNTSDNKLYLEANNSVSLKLPMLKKGIWSLKINAKGKMQLSATQQKLNVVSSMKDVFFTGSICDENGFILSIKALENITINSAEFKYKLIN